MMTYFDISKVKHIYATNTTILVEGYGQALGNPSLSESLQSKFYGDYDVQMTMNSLLQELPDELHPHHIKGHQDTQ
eukprot:12939867-Ditylum_brightwellii.AAC.1